MYTVRFAGPSGKVFFEVDQLHDRNEGREKSYSNYLDMFKIVVATGVITIADQDTPGGSGEVEEVPDENENVSVHGGTGTEVEVISGKKRKVENISPAWNFFKKLDTENGVVGKCNLCQAILQCPHKSS